MGGVDRVRGDAGVIVVIVVIVAVVVVVWRRGRTRGRGIEGHKCCP